MTTPRTKASIKYNSTHVKQIKLNLNLRTDQDIINHLETLENKQGYIKGLIREDIAKEQEGGSGDEAPRNPAESPDSDQ